MHSGVDQPLRRINVIKSINLKNIKYVLNNWMKTYSMNIKTAFEYEGCIK